MTDTMTSQNIDLSSWDTLYIFYTKSSMMYTYTESKVRDVPWNSALHRAVRCDLGFAENTRWAARMAITDLTSS